MSEKVDAVKDNTAPAPVDAPKKSEDIFYPKDDKAAAPVVDTAKAGDAPAPAEDEPIKPLSDFKEEKPAEGSTVPAKDESKKDDEPKPDSGDTVPAELKLELPKDSPLGATELDSLTAFAKEIKLTQEQAQKLVNQQSTAVEAFKEKQMQQLETNKVTWFKESETDTEIGGAHFRENVKYAHAALERFGSDRLKDELNKTGFGNHPELIRLMAKVGKEFANDNFERGASGTPRSEKSMTDIFYPNSKN